MPLYNCCSLNLRVSNKYKRHHKDRSENDENLHSGIEKHYNPILDCFDTG